MKYTGKTIILDIIEKIYQNCVTLYRKINVIIKICRIKSPAKIQYLRKNAYISPAKHGDVYSCTGMTARSTEIRVMVESFDITPG